MPSATEELRSRKALSRHLADTFEIWNRKLHFYIGLLLLFFLWLFALTGLLLNHPNWTFAEFWPNRKQTDVVREIQSPPPGDDLVQARDIMRQLGIEGEIEWTTTRSDPTRFEFQAVRPGHAYQIRADLRQNRVTLHRDREWEFFLFPKSALLFSDNAKLIHHSTKVFIPRTAYSPMEENLTCEANPHRGESCLQ